MPGLTPRPNAKKPWTEDEDAALRQMVTDRRPYREIADRLGRSCVAVNTRTLKLGLSIGVTAAERAAARDETRRLGSNDATWWR